MLHEALRLFHETFGAAPLHAASAPGRVTLLGDHTDYNGGPVLVIASQERTTVAIGLGDPDLLELAFSPERRPERIAWQSVLPKGPAGAVVGVLREMWAAEILAPNTGVRIAVLPPVAEKSGTTTAPLAVALARALSALAGAALPARKLAGLAFRAEHDHLKLRRGFVDHTVAALARSEHALLLECASLSTRLVPFAGRVLVVVPGTTGRSRRADRRAEQRKAESASAVTRLRVELPELIWLASWPVKWLARLKKALPEPLRSRAVHVVSESARVRYAAQLLERNRMRPFGRLWQESDESLRRSYADSTPALDLVVRAAGRAGALGARVSESGTAAGGAAAIVLVSGDRQAARVSEAIRRAVGRSGARAPRITSVEAGGGVRLERMGSG